jgi:hypothetical protein
MMRRLWVLGMAMALLMPFAAAATESGVNQSIDVEGTPIDSLSTPSVSTDGVDFTITVALNETAKNNGTTVQWTVQQCINSGVCYPPELFNMSETDGVWTDTLTPVDTHSYVNYDIVLTYPDAEDTERFPEQGFSKGAKVWSDCWVSGEESGGNNCPDPDVEDNGVPALGLFAGIAVTFGAAMLAKRED